MRHVFRIFLIAVMAFFLAQSAQANSYYAVGGGYGGDADAGSFSPEVGLTDVSLFSKKFLMALSIPVISHGDEKFPSGTIDSSCPHDNYEDYKTVDEGTEIGLLGKLGLNLFDSKLFLFSLAGATDRNVVDVTWSNVTGDFYKQSSYKVLSFVYGAGVGYFPELFDWKLRLNFHASLDNRRGFVLALGCHW